MLARALLLAACAALVFALGLWCATFSPSYKECKEHYQKHEIGSETDKLDHSVLDGSEFRIFFRCQGIFLDQNNGTLTAVATILLVFVTGGLLWIARDQSATSRAQLRAYIGIHEAHVENIELNEVPIAFVKIKNFGVTPAYQMTQWTRMGFAEYPLKGGRPPKPTDEKTLAQGILQPSGEIIARPKPRNETLNQPTIDALRAGTHAIYVEGHITYVDAFGHERHTRFLLFTGGEVGFSNNLAAYRAGNEAT